MTHRLDPKTKQYARTCEPGMGFGFHNGQGLPASSRTVFVLRGHDVYGRYSVYTTVLDDGRLFYTIVDWEQERRGVLRDGLKVPLGGELNADDKGLVWLLGRLGSRTNEQQLWPTMPLDLEEIILASDQAPQAEEPTPGTDLVHVGGLPALTKTDRCDQCNTQSFVAVRLHSGKRLDFCAHHYNQNAVDLLTRIDCVRDERDQLVKR